MNVITTLLGVTQLRIIGLLTKKGKIIKGIVLILAI